MYPEPYVTYLVHFHGDRDYFECHEVLEEYWKEDPSGGRKSYLVGLIQIAVGLYHYRRGNSSGATRMLANAIRILSREKDAVSSLGLEEEKLFSLLKETLKNIQDGLPYKSIDLPINDPALLHLCREEAERKHIHWGTASDIENSFLINKHSLRNRSSVIEEREKQLKKKRESRGL
ncbi:DUF309 domain-containing protein [Bacillus lacus]|uniref:DUF309 domain-containing protein n=1 Tax=Metabacillus lacus TaxID=1983721 RepID=A0A7X2IWF0_9BACI|nr:DUF309 domain-containing protein [Metabacillus lacus]MRX71058.1 DUF309 domain-containing protein [Metabacillus lacus]